MKTSTSTILTFLPALTLAAPTSSGTLSRRQFTNDAAILQAAMAWQSDTSMVSSFLDRAASGSLTGDAFANAAGTALNAELNEANPQKVTLDAAFLNTGTAVSDQVAQANDVLATQGTFQQVVDGLRDLMMNGALLTPSEIQDAVDDINQNRCANVLPAIDMYFQAVSDFEQNGQTFMAVRPAAC